MVDCTVAEAHTLAVGVRSLAHHRTVAAAPEPAHCILGHHTRGRSSVQAEQCGSREFGDHSPHHEVVRNCSSLENVGVP